jgi:hypothetical protein
LHRDLKVVGSNPTSPAIVLFRGIAQSGESVRRIVRLGFPKGLKAYLYTYVPERSKGRACKARELCSIVSSNLTVRSNGGVVMKRLLFLLVVLFLFVGCTFNEDYAIVYKKQEFTNKTVIWVKNPELSKKANDETTYDGEVSVGDTLWGTWIIEMFSEYHFMPSK